MKTSWKEERCSMVPEMFMKLNDTTYIQRRNIEKLPLLEDGSDGGYKCECRKISVDVYDELQENVNLVRQVVLETTNTAAYEDGYQAAMILLGGEE